MKVNKSKGILLKRNKIFKRRVSTLPRAHDEETGQRPAFRKKLRWRVERFMPVTRDTHPRQLKKIYFVSPIHSIYGKVF